MFRLANEQNTRRAKGQSGNIVPIAVPFKGLNARAPFAVMGQEYAISLINVIPESYGMRTRKGYSEWATNLPGTGSVCTMLSYYPPTAAPLALAASFQRPTLALNQIFTTPRSQLVPEQPVRTAVAPAGKLFAGKANQLFNVTAGGFGPWTAETGVTGTSDYWTGINFNNAAGPWLIVTNDLGGYWTYDGTTWTKRVAGAGVGQINGVNPDLFCFVLAWKHRLWFIEKNSTRAWYLPTNAIAGLAKQFDFGEQFRHGGSLAMLASLTGGGESIDDYLVAVSSQGDIAIYKGTDPDV